MNHGRPATIGGNTRGHGRSRGSYRGRGPSRGRGRGRGRERAYGYFGLGCYNQRNENTPQKWNVYKAKPDKRKRIQKRPKKNDSIYFRCSGHNHWSRTCRTPKHLVELYQASLKEKENGKDPETNFMEDSDFMDITQFNVFDFLDDLNDKVTNSTGDGNIRTN